MNEETPRPRRIKCIALSQLLVAFLVPIAIAVYTFVQNHNDQSIASANREKDLEIARKQREQDLQLADDQQKANILASYEDFLVQHLNSYGMTLNESQSARFVARLKTLAAVNQLDSKRKTFLLRSLFEASLITQNVGAKDPDRSTIINLERADLSFISFENRQWKYLSLPETNLTGANFAYADLSCANFRSAILHFADLSDSAVLTVKGQCFPESQSTLHTNFKKADLYKARLSKAHLLPTDFSESKLIGADLRSFFCTDCFFHSANFSQSDLSNAEFRRNSFINSVDFTETKLHSTYFDGSTFSTATFRRISASNVKFDSCSFTGTSFVENQFIRSSFIRSNFSTSTFIDSTLSHLTFVHCDLNDVTFIRSIFINVQFNETNVSQRQFINCTFTR